MNGCMCGYSRKAGRWLVVDRIRPPRADLAFLIIDDDTAVARFTYKG